MFRRKILLLLQSIVLLFLSLSSLNVTSAQTSTLTRVDEYNCDVGYTVDVVGNYAYITDNDGISIFDISNPSNVVKTQSIALPSGALDVHIVNGIAYVAGVLEGFYIVNVTDVFNPEILGHANGTGWTAHAFVLGELAFVSDYFSGLIIYDVSNKSNPVEESTYYSSGNMWAIVAKENVAYVATPSLGIEILDITNSSDPFRTAILTSALGATCLSIQDNTLYVGKHGSGLSIYDISTPSSPDLIGSYNDDDGGEELGVSGNDTYIAVADNYGIELFDMTGLPTITKLAEQRDNVGGAHDVDLKGNYIYAVDAETGFFVLEISKQPVTTPTEPPTDETNFPVYALLSLLMIITLKRVIIRRKRE